MTQILFKADFCWEILPYSPIHFLYWVKSNHFFPGIRFPENSNLGHSIHQIHFLLIKMFSLRILLFCCCKIFQHPLCLCADVAGRWWNAAAHPVQCCVGKVGHIQHPIADMSTYPLTAMSHGRRRRLLMNTT